MSMVSILNRKYGGFFKDVGGFSILPYYGVYAYYSAGLSSFHPAYRHQAEIKARKNTFFAFTTLTIIPVLPVLTLITFSLGIIAATIAALSALITYPVAGLADLLIPEDDDRKNYAPF